VFELPARMTQLQALIRAHQVSAQAAVSAQVQRGQALAARFSCVVDELALAEPSAGPLSGIALAHKDIFQLQGWLPGCGVGRGHAQPGVPAAVAVAALQQAGASQWATLVMAPQACGVTSNNPHFERCANPLDEAAAVGGSSSGSAVAVAAGVSYAALGTDTAGSVRIPAATCGLIGLKTTHGAVSTQGCAPLAPSLDSVGILSRYAQDAREIWSALCPQLTRPVVGGMTRGRLWLPQDGVMPEVADAIRAWASQLDAALMPVDMADEFETLSRHAQRVLLYETAHTHRAALLNGSAEPSVQAIGLMGLGLPQAWYQASMQLRAGLLQDFVRRHFSDAEFLILPSLACSVPDWQTVEVGHSAFDRAPFFAMHHYMGFVNYLGLPSLNLPIARDARGRPICVQVLARPFAEHRLLDFAEQVDPIFWSH
jgi:Asp-tRNA(Asn)/Glu-tRNA(Gln) amidotransferase A subunit family amidase